MEMQEYRKMHELGKAHWWFLGSDDMVISLLKTYLPKKRGMKILDLGCGPGRLLDSLRQFGKVTGVDVEARAIKYCKERGHNDVVLADAARLPFRDGTYGAVVIVDLLYHKRAEEQKVLAEAFRVLKKGGIILVSECAFEFLRSSHDTAMHAKKRFVMGEMKGLLKSAGFRMVKSTYWNFFLFPVVAFTRIALRGKGGGTSDIEKTPEIANSLLKNLLYLENRIIKHLDMPFGVSVVCVAKKAVV